MKKLNSLLSIVALSMTLGLLTSCSKSNGNSSQPSSGGDSSGDTSDTSSTSSSSEDPVIPDEFVEAEYEEYMAALEGKTFGDVVYKKVLINGSVKEYGESEALATFSNEPVRFKEGMSRPFTRPQMSKKVNNYAMSYIMQFARNWSEEEGTSFYLNKGNAQTPYMVKTQELVAEGIFAETTFIYNAAGMTASVKSVAHESSPDPLIFNAVDYRPLKDLTFSWLEKDTIDSFESLSYAEFIAKAQAFEAATCEYKSGHVSGTFGTCNSETFTTIENEVLIPGDERFESLNYKYDLIEIFHNRASHTSNYDTNYYYYSETLDSLMLIMNMASGNIVLERTYIWNNNGLPTSVKDVKYGNCEIFGATRTFNLTLSYSKEEATVTLTLLAGLGAWADGSTSKTVTVNIGTYLGNALNGVADPTCEGMTLKSGSLARQDGSFMNYGVKLLDDITLTYMFYNAAGAPTILTFVEPSAIQMDLVGYTSATPMIVYTTDGSNNGFYFTSGAKQTISYTFEPIKGVATQKSLYIYGANPSLGDAEGPFIKSNCSLSSLTLNENVSVLDYAFAWTCVECVSFQGSTLSSVGNYAFAHCEYLTDFYCGRINNIGNYAFAQSGLKGLFTCAKYAETIGEKAFDECEDLYGVLVDYTVLSYKETYMWNRFVKNDQVAPAGWDANWNGDAQIVYELTEESFLHGSDKIPVTGVVGGSSGEDTICFAINAPYSETETNKIYVAAYANNKITVMNQDLTVLGDTSESIEKTIEGIEGGQHIIVEVYGEEALNSSEYLINFNNNN